MAFAILFLRGPRTQPAGLRMNEYLAWKRATTKNPKTTVMYRLWVQRFLNFIKKRPITLSLVMEFKQYLIGREYSPKNIQYGLTLVRDYLSYENTVNGLGFPLKLLKIPQERSNSHHAITPVEFTKMLSVLRMDDPIMLQRKLILSLLWDTGMRVGELVALRLSDLKGRQAVIKNEKNHRNRLVAWTVETDRLLKHYLPLRTGLKSPTDFLFISFQYVPRKALSTRQVERIFKEVSHKAGLGDHIRPHGMRHGFTHAQLHKNRPITTLAQMLGHSTVFNVLTYTQLNSNEIKDAWGIE